MLQKGLRPPSYLNFSYNEPSPEDKINQAYSTLRDMVELGFIEVVLISDLLEKAKEVEIKLNLYASDAANLSSSLVSSTNMLSEDKHLLRKSVKDFMEKVGLKVLRLKDLYPKGRSNNQRFYSR